MTETKATPKGFGRFFLALPWPYHLALAGVTYLILQALAGREIPLPGPDPVETALYTHRLVWKNAAAVLQYLLPGASGLAALCSLRQGRKKRAQG